MFVQPNLPKFCLVINWFTIRFSGFIIQQYTLTKQTNKIPLSCGKKWSVFCRESCHLSPFYSWARFLANLRSAWLLQEVAPDLGFLVWTITIKVWWNTEPNYWFPSADYSIVFRPILSIERRKAIMGLRWANCFPKPLISCAKLPYHIKKSYMLEELNMRYLILFLFQVQTLSYLKYKLHY